MVAELGDMVGVRTKPKIATSITELIGNTPLLKLDRSVEGLDATILAKLESMEPCSSVKDRIGYSMITEAEKRGDVRPEIQSWPLFARARAGSPVLQRCSPPSLPSHCFLTACRSLRASRRSSSQPRATRALPWPWSQPPRSRQPRFAHAAPNSLAHQHLLALRSTCAALPKPAHPMAHLIRVPTPYAGTRSAHDYAGTRSAHDVTALVRQGYDLVLTMPESMSMERRVMLKALGAKLVLTPAPKGMGGAVKKAEMITAEMGAKAYMLQQFNNPDK